MGEMPTPFPEYALEKIIIVANGLAAFLTAFTFLALCLRRITTDHYFVCSNLNLSMSLYFVMVVIALNVEKDTTSCRVSAIINHYVVVSSCAWIFNFCLQHFLKLRFGMHKNVYAKISYIIIGWVSPLLYVLPFGSRWYSTYGSGSSCLVPDKIEILHGSIVPAAVMTLSSCIIIMWLYFKFDHFVFTYGSELWYILWDEFFRISLVVPLFAITWILGLQDIRKNLLAGYAFAMTCFCCGSVCYLGYFATNKVVLRSIRSRFYGAGNDDPDEISFSPYGSDDEDECVSSIAMPGRRRKSGISTHSHTTTSTVVMHDISMPGTSGQATDLAQKVTGDVARISICTDEPRLKLQDYDDDDD